MSGTKAVSSIPFQLVHHLLLDHIPFEQKTADLENVLFDASLPGSYPPKDESRAILFAPLDVFMTGPPNRNAFCDIFQTPFAAASVT